jgi:hypothetical protein
VHMYPEYVIENGQHVSRGVGMEIRWQEGTFMEVGKNGSMLEQPIRALLHHVAQLQSERPCRQNAQITEHLNAVLGLLDERTRERNSRGVLGTTTV